MGIEGTIVVPEEKEKWRLAMGCHRGTLMSRDYDNRTYDSLEECKAAVKEAEQSWRAIGYRVWFAEATGPKGEKVKLHEGTPYA